MRWLALVGIAMSLILVSCGPGGTASGPAPGASTATVGAPGQIAPTTAISRPTLPAGGATTVPAGLTAATATPAPPPLFLELIEPAGETVEVAESVTSVAIVGRTLPTAVVSVNGELASPDASGVFRAEVPLEDEMTLIEVVASDASGAEERIERMVVR